MGKYFGTDGFRGEAGIDLTADHAYKVGRFLGWYYNALRERNGNNEPARIVIGKDTRRSYGFHQFIRGDGVVHRAAVDFEFGDFVGEHARTHALQQLLGGFHITQHGHVFQAQRALGEKAGAHQRQGGIFGAGHGDFAVERAVAGNFEFVHRMSFVARRRLSDGLCTKMGEMKRQIIMDFKRIAFL